MEYKRKIQEDEFQIDLANGMIGKGNCSSIYRCTRNKGDKETCCVKIYQQGDIGDVAQNIINLESPNLVKVHQVSTVSGQLAVYMELCDGGDMNQVIRDKKGVFTEDEAINIVRQIINGYKSLKQVSMIHGDLKPSNIVLDKNGIYKITDFGLEAINSKRISRLTMWAAPQIFFEQSFTAKADMYSLGIIFYELLFYTYPTRKISNIQQMKAFLERTEYEPIECPEKKFPIHTEIKKLIERMIQYSEEKRISWEELYKHPFFVKNQMRIQKFLDVLLNKGDQAIAICHHLQNLINDQQILTPFEQALTMTSLIGYKLLTLQNCNGFAFNNPNQIDDSFKKQFNEDTLLEVLKIFHQDKDKVIQTQKDDIQNQYREISEQFQVYHKYYNTEIWRNILTQFERQGIPESLQSFFKLLNLQTPTQYNLYHQWFIYFNQVIISPKLPYKANEQYNLKYLKFIYICQKFIRTNDDFPFHNYWDTNTEEIVDYDKNEQVIRSYLDKK